MAPGGGGGTHLHLLMSHTWVEQPLGTGPGLGSMVPGLGRPGKEQVCEICAPGDQEEESQPSQREGSRRESRPRELAASVAHRYVLLAQGLVYNLN